MTGITSAKAELHNSQ